MKDIQNIKHENLRVGRFRSVRPLTTVIFLILCANLLNAQDIHFSTSEILEIINPYHSILELTNNEKGYQAIRIQKKDYGTIQEMKNTKNWYKLLEKRPVQIDTKVIYYEKFSKKHPRLSNSYYKEVTIYIESIDKTITKEILTAIELNSDTISFHIKELEFIEVLKPNHLAILPMEYLEWAKNTANPIYAKILVENTNGKIECINILKKEKEKIKQIENSTNEYQYFENQIIVIDTLTTLWIKRTPSRGCYPGPDCQVWVLGMVQTKTTDTIKIYIPNKIDAHKLGLYDKSVTEIFVFPTNENQYENLFFDKIMKLVFADFYANNLKIHLIKNVFGTGEYLIQINKKNEVLT